MPSGDIPATEFTPHHIPPDENGCPEFVRVLARPGAGVATLSIVAGGGSIGYALNQSQVLILIESAAESLRRMQESSRS